MRLEAELRLTITAPISVGSGAISGSMADKPILKSADGSPVLPGSTVKGRTRHAAEQLARALYAAEFDGRWPGCRPPREPCRAGDLCPVCRVFGTLSAPSPLVFGNLRLALYPAAQGLSPAWREPASRTELRSGIGIDRALGTVKEDLLFSSEAHRPAPGIVYAGRIQGDVSVRPEAGLLLGALRLVDAWGGGRSRGLGWGTLACSVRLDDKPADSDDLIRELGTARWP
jgi:CRISPR/Cas system CSM-associated protein Csm3 (group 7 of RAMP superfamily)